MLDGADYAVQNVINSLKRLYLFKSLNIFRLFHDADNRLVARTTNFANVVGVVGIVAANFAEFHLLFDVAQGVDKVVDFAVATL